MDIGTDKANVILKGTLMQPSTVEKALHRWPLWRDSILRARSKFDFEPLPTGEQLRKWKWHNNNAVWNYGQKEMKRLGLPQSAGYYWLACFYANYIRADGTTDYDAITDVLFTSEGELSNKAYPLLYEYSVTVAASTPQELLSIKIKPAKDVIVSLPPELESIMKSIRGRLPERSEIELEIKQGNLTYEQVLRRIGESGDIQAEWFSIKHRCRSNVVALQRARRGLLSRVNGIGRRLWERAGRPPPDRKRSTKERNRQSQYRAA